MALTFKSIIRGLKQLYEDYLSTQDKLDKISQKSDHVNEEMQHILTNVTSLASEDLPDILSDILLLAEKIKLVVSKGQALQGHGIEESIGLIELSEAISQLQSDMVQGQGRVAVRVTVASKLREIIAADPEASKELLALIGKEVVEEWLKDYQEQIDNSSDGSHGEV